MEWPQILVWTLMFVLYTCLYLARISESSNIHILSKLSCDFDDRNTCEWDNIRGSGHEWSLHKSNPNAQIQDHTSGIGFGHFLQTSASHHKRGQNDARLVSPKVNIPPTGLCLRFWYFMYGENTSQLDVNQTLDSSNETRCLWTKQGSNFLDWNYAEVDLVSESQKAAIIFAAKRRSGEINMALDDISIEEGPCMSRFSCDFDAGNTCDFIQSLHDDYDWTVDKLKENAIVDERNRTMLCKNITSEFWNDTFCVNETSERIINSIEDRHFYETTRKHFILGEINNQFLLIDSLVHFPSPGGGGNTAVLMSPEFNVRGPFCFRFWYYIYGAGFLDVISSSGISNHNYTLWSQTGQDVAEWRLGAVDILTKPPYKILIQASVESIGTSFKVSLDNIDTVPGTCLNRFTCDFEDAQCEWQNAPLDSDDLNWVRTMGEETKSWKYVQTDHTFGSRYGKYLMLSSSAGILRENNGKLISPNLIPNTTYCLEFWHILESDYARVHIKYENVSLPLHSIPGPQRPFWQSFKETIPASTSPFRLIIEGMVDNTNDHDILIDDLALQIGACDHSKRQSAITSLPNTFHCRTGDAYLFSTEVCDFSNDCPEGEEEEECGYSCTFEGNNNCRWFNETNREGTFWNRTSREELPGTLGAEVDHTTNKTDGHFLYLLDFSSIRHTLRATLTSPILRKASPNCKLSFYIKPLTADDWQINVYKITARARARIFSISQLQEKRWQEINVLVGFSQEPFQLEIKSERIKPYITCIALDDISLKDCDFPKPSSVIIANNTNFQCRNEAPLDVDKVCNFEIDCDDSYDESETICSNYTLCNFETDMCGWKQERHEDDYDWLRQEAAASQQVATGPTVDHTTGLGSGFVLEMTHQDRLPGDKAWILSPVLDPSIDCRMSFFLYMFGLRVDNFNVYTRQAVGGPLIKHLSRTGDVGEIWRLESVTFNSASQFQIVLEGVKGYGELVEIGLDDVSLSPECKISNGNLPKITTKPVPTPLNPCNDSRKWECKDRSQCIYKYRLCDFTPQCSDQSDEGDCGKCDFESSMCGWKDVSRSRYVWQRANSTPTSSKDFRPERDHTKGQKGIDLGWYMLIQDKGHGYTRFSHLVSPVLGHTTATCTMTFYYFSSRQGGIELLIFSRNTTSYDYAENGIYKWRSEHTADGWAKATANIGSLEAGFQLVFRHRRIAHLQEIVFALDDISFSPSCGDGKNVAPCADDEFRCHSSGECKSEHHRCDYVKDCPEGEDESNCDGYKMADFQYAKDWFLNDRTSDFKWLRLSGYGYSSETKPRYDLTEDSVTGRYLYMDPLKYSESNIVQKSRIRSYVLYPNPSGDCYIRFFYQSAGDQRGKLQIYTQSRKNAGRTVLWTMPRGMVNQWRKIVLQLKSKTSFRVYIEGSRRPGYGGGVAIDGVSFNSRCFFMEWNTPLPRYGSKSKHNMSCRQNEVLCNNTCSIPSKCGSTLQCIKHGELLNCPTSCNFDNGMCEWTQKRWHWSKSAPWRIESLSNIASFDPKPKGAPRKVLIAGLWTKKNDRTKHWLISPTFQRVSPLCTFSLMYYYTGRLVYLTVNRRMAGYDQPLHFRTNRWTPKSNSGQWVNLFLAIPPCSEQFQIVIKVTMKNENNNSFFIIDNFNFNNCNALPPPKRCASSNFKCPNGVCISKDQICDQQPDCCDGSDEDFQMCSKYKSFTFESGINEWKNRVNTKYTWEIKTGRMYMNEVYRRPSWDHTKRALYGRYLSTSRRAGRDQKAVMVYAMPAPSGVCNIVFWYQLECTNQALCNITILTKTMDGIWTLISTFSYPWIANSWKKASLSLEMDEPYLLIFEGRLDKERMSSLNIDDIIFSPGCITPQNGSMISPHPSALAASTDIYRSGQCAINEFKCKRSQTCIDFSYFCNKDKDCPDGSDESVTSCDEFTFLDLEGESPLLHFEQIKTDSFDWLLWNTSREFLKNGNVINRSFGRSNGQFLLAVGSDNTTDFDTASIMYLPVYTAKDSCVIRVHVLLPSKSQAVTISYRLADVVDATDQPLSTTAPSVYGFLWQPLTVVIRSPKRFRLVLTGVPGTPGGVVGVDDILFGPGCRRSD